ncbi:uncharacterized protein [Fopius arisanus]|uniref:Pacifastin domain-containing protein n=1 Tax=Fopius arisanus TaxID=64838 RepID=A0A9R1THH3_9HYME|nr:PREDICTED: uncharacterized protein LOC105270470 [Fopius arisanus]
MLWKFIIFAVLFTVITAATVQLEPLNADGTCEPGRSYSDGCNTCICAARDMPMCTQMLCYPRRS